MSLILRSLAVAAFTLFAASVASAQTPGLRPVPTSQSGTRPVATASPVPLIVERRQMEWENAYRQAVLWRMYQPPVIVVNNPWGPIVNPNPWGPIVNRNPWGPTVTTPTSNVYRTYTSPWVR